MARPKSLSIVIVLLALSTLNALLIMLTRHDFFLQHFPGTTPLIYWAYVVTAAGILLGLYGLWRLRRWSIAVLTVASLLTFLLDFFAGAPLLHKLATIAALLLLAILSKPVWPQLFTSETKP